MTGTGTQTDPYIVSTWDEFLAAIAQDGVYVNLAETYTWNLDEIYADSVIPSEIPIGYNTIVDGKDSVVTSSKVNFNTCDFSGTRATIKNLYFLRGKDGSFYHDCIYLLDSQSQVLSLPYQSSSRCRYKVVPDLVIDLNDRSSSTTITVNEGAEIYGNGLVIKNSRDLQFTIREAANYSYAATLHDVNIIDCLCQNRTMFDCGSGYGWGFNRCSVKAIVEYSMWNSGNYLSINQCNLSLTFLVPSTNALYAYRSFSVTDSNIYIYNANLSNKASFKNCYVCGEIPDTVTVTTVGLLGVNVICEIKTNKSFASYSSQQGIVINKDLAPNSGLTSGANGYTLLTTEEIRNPQKLFDAGIPINPTGG